MTNSGNQIRNKMIREYPKTDRQKLSGIEKMLHKEFPTLEVFLEPFMMFTKGEDEFVGYEIALDEELVKTHTIHPPDIVINCGNNQVIFELDGDIHNIKTEKTAKRNRRYELNDLNYFVINESDLKLKLGMPKTRPLTQEQINEEFLIGLKKFT